MDRNRIIIIAIILCLFLGNVVYILATGEREPFLYAMNNRMNYEMPKEETDMAENEPVEMEDEVELSTETTSEQKERMDQKTEKKTVNNNDNSNNKKSDKKSDKNSDEKSDEEGDTGDNKESGDETVVEAKKLVELICTWKNSDKLLYGKDMVISDIYVTGRYDNGDTESIPIENCTIDGFNSKKLGKGTCTISYYGLSGYVDYIINNYELSIFCDSWDKRYKYKYGDAFSNSDIIIAANMADGSKEQIQASKLNVSGIEMKKVGDHVCTISYKNFSLSEKYIVHNYPVSLTSSIEVFSLRGDVSWSDIADGQTVTASMADGTTKKLSADDYLVSGYSPVTEGNKEMTISYEGVSLTIPYVVYYDSIRIDMGEAIGKSVNVHFTSFLDITSTESLGIEGEYVDSETGDTYILKGIYQDSKYTNELKIPKTYTANKRYRVNSEGLPWHEYILYARYEKKVD